MQNIKIGSALRNKTRHPIASLQGKPVGEKKRKQWQILFAWVPKSLWMVTTAMKLKDVWSLEEKL